MTRLTATLNTSIMALIIVTMLAGASLAQESRGITLGPSRMMPAKKPDLIISQITANVVQREAQKVKVVIRVTVKNNAVGPRGASTAAFLTSAGRERHCAGVSRLLLGYRRHSTGGFNYLDEAEVVALNPGASRTYTFSEWVSLGTWGMGTFREYRATVDHLNWIAEWNEGNNIATTNLIAR